MKKLVSLLLAVCMCLSIGTLLTSCDGNSQNNGTYYLFDNGVTDKDSWVKIDGSKWSDNDGMSGSFELDGENISFYVELDGEKELLLDGTLKDGKLTIGGSLVSVVYYLDGKAPKDDDSGEENNNTDVGELEFTLDEESDTYFVTGLGTFTGSKVDIPSTYNGKAVTKITGIWGPNDFVEEIIIPDSVIEIKVNYSEYVQHNYEGTFQDFRALKYIEFGDGITAIPSSICKYNTALTTIVFGSNIESIGEYAFYRTGISTLELPDSIMSIGAQAFNDCGKLTDVRLPAIWENSPWDIGQNTRYYIGQYAFGNCKKLQSVYYSGSEEDWGNHVLCESNAFYNTHDNFQITYEK